MRKKSLFAGGGAIIATFTIGAFVGLMAPSIANGDVPDTDQTEVRSTSQFSSDSGNGWIAPDEIQYEVNEFGLTFGRAGLVESVEMEPDLILAVATNGQVGYVYNDQLDPPAKSPEQAEKVTQQSDQGYQIPVYLSDGVTEIGVFQVGGAEAR